MRIWVQKSASMQKRTSPQKFSDFAEKSVLNSVSDLSTKVRRVRQRGGLPAVFAAAVGARAPRRARARGSRGVFARRGA